MNNNATSKTHLPSVNLLDALNDVAKLQSMDHSHWTQIIRLARQNKAMSKLAYRASVVKLDEQIDPAIADHLIAARVVSRQHARLAHWEANRIAHALAKADYDVVFLKGGAYVLAGLPAGRGRLISDVDIMVPKANILDAEQKLLAAGWQPIKLDDYDQRYYRQWMHELPPLRHKDRRNVVDLHHTILPETGRLKPDASKLFTAAIPIPGLNPPGHPARIKMLAPVDMILHSAAHLFQDGDLAGGLRDLLDLDDLLRHFGEHEPGFWEQLVERSKELDLHRPTFYALRFTSELLNTPIPAEVLNASRACGPVAPVKLAMDRLAHLAFMPDLGQGERTGSSMARWMLYVRSHWLRMPPWLLAQHLSRKAMSRFQKPEEVTPQTTEQKNVDATRVG